MDGSDDYFADDDIVLDDATLALLDQAETRATQAAAAKPAAAKPAAAKPAPARPAPRPPAINPLVRQTDGQSLPAAKRQRLSSGYLQRQPSVNGNDASDLPEISIHADGSYALPGTKQTPALAAGPSRLREQSAAPSQNLFSGNPTAPPTRVLPPRRFENGPAGASTFSARLAQAASRQAPALTAVSSRVTTNSQQRAPAHPPERPQAPAPPHIATDAPPRNAVDSHAQSEIDALKVRLDELHQANVAAQKALKDAQDAKYASAGEVSILRKNMDKKDQEHANDIQKLKAAKVQAEEKQLELERSMREELERQRTDFMFKQHELQMSSRKVPQSTRAKKRVNPEVPPTPVAVPTEMQGWSRRVSSQLVQQTPRRPQSSRRPQPADSPTPQKHRSQFPLSSPEKGKKFRGFENAFAPAPTTPSRTKGKGRAGEGDTFFRSPAVFAPSPTISDTFDTLSKHSSSPHQMDIDMGDLAERSSPSRAAGIQMRAESDSLKDDMSVVDDEDIDMDDGQGSNVSESNDDYPSVDWVYELRDLVFAHVKGPDGSLTLQTLMAASSSLTALPGARADYSKACSRMMALLGPATAEDRVDVLFSTLCACLIRMADILSVCGCIPALIAVLNLNLMLVLSFPEHTTSMLSAVMPGETDQSTPRMIDILNFIVRTYMVPVSQNGAHPLAEPERTQLAMETLRLMEALACDASDEAVDELARFPTAPSVLLTLLHPKQSLWVLEKTVRLLALIAGRPAIFRHLLSYPEGYNGPAPDDYTKLPHIERLGAFLVDGLDLHIGPEADEFKMTILSFIGTLASAHPDAHEILLASQTLIPAIVLFLANRAKPIFEDDWDLRSNKERIPRAIMMLRQTLYLLHYLILSRKILYNLPGKLNDAPYRQFSGALHVVLVTIGQITYADTPLWVGSEDRHHFEEMRELGRDLLDLLSEGPEWEDEVAAAFTWESDEEPETNVTEEEEAMLMDTDETHNSL